MTGSPLIPNGLPVTFDRVETLIPPIDSRLISGDNLAAMMFAEIRTERLVLRDLEVGDASRIFGYRSHPDVSRFQSWGTRSADDIEAYIGEPSEREPGRPGSWYQIGIILVPGRELIADCGFQVLETEPRHVEIGVALAPEFQGLGYPFSSPSSCSDSWRSTASTDEWSKPWLSARSPCDPGRPRKYR